jgi:hypothetical protein
MISGTPRKHKTPKSKGINVSHLKKLKTKYEKRIACLKARQLTLGDVVFGFIAGVAVGYWIATFLYCR